MIRKQGNKWVVLSHDGKKRLGSYGSKAEAVKRLRQVEFYKDKHAKECYSLECTLPDLDNGNYAIEKDVPVFHDNGEGRYSPNDLQEICDNTNARQNTCDLPAIVIGHIREELPEHLQPPLVGFARNFRVANFANRPTIIADLAIHNDHVAEAKKYPRRSAEIWQDGKYIDPIALLGASTPARDLSLMFAKKGHKDCGCGCGGNCKESYCQEGANAGKPGPCPGPNQSPYTSNASKPAQAAPKKRRGLPSLGRPVKRQHASGERLPGWLLAAIKAGQSLDVSPEVFASFLVDLAASLNVPLPPESVLRRAIDSVFPKEQIMKG